MRRSYLKIILALASVLLALPGQAQGNYPSRPLTLLLSVGPGGALDVVARILQPGLQEALGQPIIIENKVGNSGNIGMAAAAKAAPDGYTLFLGSSGLIAINPAVFKNLNVNPAKDFEAVTMVAETPGVLVASTAYAPNTVKEFVADAKARPGQVFYASPGNGSQNRLELEMLRQMEGLDMVHVPYKGGAGEATVAVASGQPQVLLTSLPSAIALVRANRLKPLAVTTAKRSEVLPQVPTMMESGYPSFVSSSWQGLFVPTGTSREIVMRLHGAMGQVLKRPDVIERLGKAGLSVVASPTPQAFGELIKADTARWAKVAKQAGATVD